MKKVDIDGYFFFDADKMPEAPVILEVGAYSTHAVKPLSQLYPKAKFVVVEASPACFFILIEKLRAFHNATACNVALAPIDGKRQFNEYAGGMDANSIFNREKEGLFPIRQTLIVGMTLPSILQKCSLTKVDLLLLNCEGAEIHAIRQLLDNEGLRNQVTQICLSFHCEHVKIYPPNVKDNLLKRLSEHYEITNGDDKVGYYLMVRK